MELRWLRVAVSEAQEARAYYESEREGLGGRFVDELNAALDRIVRLPHAWPSAEAPVRRTAVNRFPYLVHYVVRDEVIIVLGVYHARRRPISWRERAERDR